MGFLFGAPKVDTPTPARMPASDDENVRAARARQRRNIFERTGRSSTVLTQDTAGDNMQSYSRSLLGSA